ncbi:GNAT family N-acetyltransferase [Cellulomonas pakistanensis]|uniref:GNAT family N-acetyltransferase n=1 Tax=Cellulomonas pakistanensis TaxID=992287 RepID=A0A919PAD0_9CELL|nr:GNAT family N-acetyltransferase [Cellulomonas pakistanensis]GIG35930.1 GNAT family N-acetyltransferase [Cellulomonas pakistanensis]
MTLPTTQPHLVPLPVPATLEHPDAWLLHGFVDACNAVLLDDWGTLDEARLPEETLRSLQHQEYTEKLRFLALDGPADGPADPARVLGYLSLDLPRQDNTHTGNADLGVRPEHRGRGIGAAVHDLAVRTARERGRTVLTGATDQRTEPEEGPGTLVPGTGSGRVRADDPAVAFLVRRGWDLEQVERRSVLAVPVPEDELARHADAAAAAAGPDYEVVRWDDRCPDAWVDQFAVLQTRMSTDAPMGGLDLREDLWDVARVRAAERQHVERGMTYRVAAAVHRPTGVLAAFTALVSRPDTDEFVYQDDTLVLREHRGHRLGMLVKTANLARLAEAQPGARRVATWNAEENSYMLAINVALGFRPAGGSGEWQLRLG